MAPGEASPGTLEQGGAEPLPLSASPFAHFILVRFVTNRTSAEKTCWTGLGASQS